MNQIKFRGKKDRPNLDGMDPSAKEGLKVALELNQIELANLIIKEYLEDFNKRNGVIDYAKRHRNIQKKR